MAEAAFGVELRRSRQAAALSLRQLAARVGYDHSYLSQVERGQRPGSPHLARLCDRALGTGSTLAAAYERARRGRPPAGTAGAPVGAPVGAGAWAAGGPAGGSVAGPGSPGAVSQTAVPADALLTPAHVSAPTAGRAVPPGLDRLEAARHDLAAAIGQVPDVAEWSVIAATYAGDYLVAAPAELLRDLTADLDLLRGTVGAAAGSAALLGAPVARLSVVMALTLTSVGRHRAAARWWRTARDTADRSDDASTRSLVRGWQADGGLRERDSATELLGLSEQALAVDPHGVGAARALAGKARALAELGRAPEAYQVLDEFRARVDDLPVAARNDPSLFGWAAYKVHWVESWVYTAIGDTAAAYDAQDRALALCPTQHRCEWAELHLHRAQCLVRDKEVAAGLATAMRVLVELPDQWHTEFLYEAAGRVLSAVPAGDLGRPAIRDYRELLLRRPWR